ncbi:MAG: phosphatidylserine decarboxylase [Phycisphaeraceae bacterium]
MLGAHTQREWVTAAVTTLLLATAAGFMLWWWALAITLIAGTLILVSFRDPDRSPPSQRGVVVSASDGTISSIHPVEELEAFDGSAVCIRTFLSLTDVHIIRMPCYGRIDSVRHQPGRHISALNPRSIEENESVTVTLLHPTRQETVAVVRLIAGQFARTIRLFAQQGDTLQRGQRLGTILLGSTVEVYLPTESSYRMMLETGATVRAGESIIAEPRRDQPVTATLLPMNQQTSEPTPPSDHQSPEPHQQLNLPDPTLTPSQPG